MNRREAFPIEIQEKALRAFVLFLLALLFYAFCIGESDKINLPILYQGRDLNRAFDLYFNQKLIWFGPEMTGGGNLPGPFYYILLGIPLLLFNSFTAVTYFEYTLAAASAVVLWSFVGRTSRAGAYLTYFFFLSSPLLLSMLALTWNPSFVFLFLSLAICCLSPTQKNSRLALGGFLLGLSLQIHFTAMIFLLAAIVAVLLERSFDFEERIRKASIVLLSSLLPLLPYFVFHAARKRPFETTSSFRSGIVTFWDSFGKTYPGMPDYFSQLKSFIFFNSNELLFFPAVIIGTFLFLRIYRTNRFIALSFLFSVLLLPWVVPSAAANRYLIPLIFSSTVLAGMLLPDNISGRNLAYYLFFGGSIIASLVYRIASLPAVSFNFSMTVLQELIALLVAGVFVFLFAGKDFQKTVFALLFLVVVGNAAFTNAVRALPQYDKSGYAGFLRVKEGQRLLNAVIESTGWNYSDFRQRTFFQGGDVETDYSFYYEYLRRKSGVPQASRFDGLLVRTKLITATKIPMEIEIAITSGEIVCKENRKVGNFELCFYNFKKPDQKRRLQNIGYAYTYHQPALAEIKKSYDVVSKGPNEAVFYWNKCENFEKSCSIFFLVKLGKNSLGVEVLGDPLGATVPPVNPAWSLGLRKPLLKVFCGGEATEFEIATSLGFRRDQSTFMAPYDAHFPLPCASPDSIAVSLSQATSYLKGKMIKEASPVSMIWKRVP